MRAFPALLLLMFAPAAAQVPDTGRLALTADTEARWIPYTLTRGNQLRFVATLDGRPATAILDTGASLSILSRVHAGRAGYRIAERGQANAIGGPVALGWTPIATLGFGGLVRTGGGLSVAALPAVVAGDEAAPELLVGRDLLDRFALEIEPTHARFRLLPSGRLPFTGGRALLTIGQRPLAYVTEVTIAGRRLRPVIVDTGDGGALTLARETWRTLPLATPPAVSTQLTNGVGGTVVADVAHLPAVTLAQRSLRDVGVAVEPTGGFTERALAAGRIGMGLLQRFRVLLDPRAGHMVLADAPPPARSPISTSGLQLGLVRDRLRVLHVMRGSPAALTGWRVGETICAVDGAVIAAAPAAAARATWPTGAPGTVVALTLCDGSRRSLTLRRFY